LDEVPCRDPTTRAGMLAWRSRTCVIILRGCGLGSKVSTGRRSSAAEAPQQTWRPSDGKQPHGYRAATHSTLAWRGCGITITKPLCAHNLAKGSRIGLPKRTQIAAQGPFFTSGLLLTAPPSTTLGETNLRGARDCYVHLQSYTPRRPRLTQILRRTLRRSRAQSWKSLPHTRTVCAVGVYLPPQTLRPLVCSLLQTVHD
jgi:hypothetical protein